MKNRTSKTTSGQQKELPIGPLHDPVTWYKITHAGEQVAQWNFQYNALAFLLELPLRNLLTSMCDFVPSDRSFKGPIEA